MEGKYPRIERRAAMDWFAKLQLLAIGFICVAYPILLFIMIWSQPVYVIISYFVWVACTLGWICIGEKKKISEFIGPVLVMLLIFTCIYVSGFSEYDMEEDALFIWVTPALSTPALCYIGYKMAVSRQSKRMEQIRIWIKSLNECYKNKIEGLNKVIMLIRNTYSSEKKIENFLNLLDSCSGNDLQKFFGEKAITKNSELLLKIKEVILEYSLTIDINNKSVGNILDEAQQLKSEYTSKIYSDKQAGLNVYNDIKNAYTAVCSRKR